jgi:formylglycine-generating enzyme required for sulfatase activity
MQTLRLLSIVLAFGSIASVICLAQGTVHGGPDPGGGAICDAVGSISVAFPGPSVQPLSAAAECGLKPKDTFKECDGCPAMVVVPSGSFMMGSPENEIGRSGNEGPLHRVTFTQPFAVGRFTVTFDEWDACVKGAGCNAYAPSDHEWGRGRQPVIYVSWDDAKAYVDWLSRKTGKAYRLLSEAEWEYAARGGTTTPFWFGSTISSNQANYDSGNSPDWSLKGKFGHKTLPVDAFEENAWGLYQMYGNVSQWTEDCYNETYDGAPTDGSAWLEGDCSSRVLRGGSLVDISRYVRSASRTSDPVEIRTFDDGFRIARTLLHPRTQ